MKFHTITRMFTTFVFYNNLNYLKVNSDDWILIRSYVSSSQCIFIFTHFALLIINMCHKNLERLNAKYKALIFKIVMKFIENWKKKLTKIVHKDFLTAKFTKKCNEIFQFSVCTHTKNLFKIVNGSISSLKRVCFNLYFRHFCHSTRLTLHDRSL